ncbi:hypothetical protein F2Q69_00012648 [Brassica cretica]|uniref:Uncharacterized protein n=1 Tax=Brassica cretica TaxID=69181 RepID=A0A8S9R514_BRACR|nr:hypothetical protein F2Q69_00012648 [Brassica cretica]
MTLYDCDAKALSKSIHPSQSYSLRIKWKCCPELVQFHGFRSVEVLLDTPSGSLTNCPEAKGGYVRVQISLSRPVCFFMMKLRLCPSRDQFSQVQSRRPLGFGQVFSDQPAAYRQRTLGFKETPYSLDREHSERRGHGLWLSGYTDGVVTGSDPTVLGLSRGDPTVMWAAIVVMTLSPKSGLGWWILKLCGIIGWPIMFLSDCWSTG